MPCTATLLLAAARPAGGAALGQVVIATTAAAAFSGALLYVCLGPRSGRVRALSRLARLSRHVSGLPGWAAVPSGMIVVSLVTALFGMLWDISLHIAQGRDPGPLANPAHYFILGGLWGVFASGCVSIALPTDRPSASAVRIMDGWYAPLGGVLIAACGAFALIGFPLDDMWHRLFGQDVTLWGPTHLMLIGGASMTLVGLAVLLVEAGRANRTHGRRGELPWARFMRRVTLPGAFLLGLSTFQGEFDFGVPQFRLVFQPMLIMLAAGAALVAARVWLGRGAALGAALFFLSLRGAIALLVGPVLGEPTPHFPLYVVSALCVEGIAFLVSPRRPLTFALAAGALIGTVGLAAEWGWSHVWMPLPWPAALLPEGALLGFAMALAGGLIGAWIGGRLAADQLPRGGDLRAGAVVAAAAILAAVVFGLATSSDRGVSGTVVLEPAGGGTANAVIRLAPPRAADDAAWLTATSWQGGALVVDRLRRVGPGVYRTTEPMPVHGEWKTMIRLHVGNSLTALPVYLPADPAIPVGGVPARERVTRPFGSDHKLLQREQKPAAGVLWAIGYGCVLALALGFLGLLGWGVHRVAAPPPAERPGVATGRARVGVPPPPAVPTGR